MLAAGFLIAAAAKAQIIGEPKGSATRPLSTKRSLDTMVLLSPDRPSLLGGKGVLL